MLQKYLFIVIFFFGISFPGIAESSTKPAAGQAMVPLRATATEIEASQYLNQYLLKNHYRKVIVNDSLSQEIFNRYINNLDGNKSYFLANDTELLRKMYGDKMDDEFLAGKTTAGFDIYNLFLKRAKEKMRYMKAAADTMHLSFAMPETLDLDRKNDPWPSDVHQLHDFWNKELKYQWLNLKYSGKNNMAIRKTLAKNFSARLNLLNRQKPEDAFHAYTYALTTSFDPHTNYFSPEEYQNFQIDMSRSLEGIGAKLQTEGEFTIVNELIPGGPALKSNLLKKGDKIVGIGQGKTGEIIDVTGWRINEVVKKIRGKKGTVVRLKILPASQGGRGSSKIVALLRDKVNLQEQAAKKSIIEEGKHKIGVISIPSFYLDVEGERQNTGNYNSTSRDVARILDELKSEHVDGIIIDLRDNGGGSLEEAVKVTGLFIPGGPVVQITDSNGGKAVLNDKNNNMHYDGPLAVLVNRYSASASEIFAAAVQDYGRGVIVGERTFGKGTVQSLIKLSRPYFITEKKPELGEIKLTIAKFYRVSGESTQHKGVEPDIIIPSMIDKTTIGEDTYPSSLPWSTISASLYKPVADITPEVLELLRKKYQDQSSSNLLYQSYLDDLNTLDQIRKRKTISLQDPEVKSETETIKKIEKQWVREQDSPKDQGKDVVLKQSATVVADLEEIRTASKRQDPLKLPVSH